MALPPTTGTPGAPEISRTPAPSTSLADMARVVVWEHLLIRLHATLSARGWEWDLPPGRCAPVGFGADDEWVRYVPGEARWAHPGTLSDSDRFDLVKGYAGPATVYWLDDDADEGLSVWYASAECCAVHDEPSTRDRQYPLTSAGIDRLVAALPAVEGHVLDIAAIAACEHQPRRTEFAFTHT